MKLKPSAQQETDQSKTGQAAEWGEIFINYMSKGRLILIIHKKFQILNAKNFNW